MATPTSVPGRVAGLVDDAAVLLPGNAPSPDATPLAAVVSGRAGALGPALTWTTPVGDLAAPGLLDASPWQPTKEPA